MLQSYSEGIDFCQFMKETDFFFFFVYFTATREQVLNHMSLGFFVFLHMNKNMTNRQSIYTKKEEWYIASGFLILKITSL
jgi:hypothetical protein